jgi:hypothetical protein
MAYLGATKMGTGAPIPLNADGSLNINALVEQLVDQQKSYIYDTLTILPGTVVGGANNSLPYRMFQIPIGQADTQTTQTKTELETNMRSPGFLAPPNDFILNNLGFYISIGADLFDISTLCTFAWFQFKILQKAQWMGHLQRHPAGMGITGQTSATGQQNWINGSADPRAIWYFGDWKKYIPPQVNFSLEINFPESYQQLFNAASTTSANLPSNIKAKLFDTGIVTAVTSLPTFLPNTAGGNGIKLIAVMNGISNGPVQ